MFSDDGKRSGWRWEFQKYIVFGLFGMGVWYAKDKVFPTDFWQTRILLNVEATYADILAVVVLLAIAVGIIVALSVHRLRSYKIYEGRENSMIANCGLIEQYLKTPSTTLRSTRVTHWRVAESSAPRQRFRNLLTDRITRRFPVRRLWQIKDQNDFLQLQRYLLTYEQFDNYSLKAVVSRDVLMPEIICVGDAAASFSLPEPTTPRELGRSFHFFGKREISALTRYFDIMWDIAIPIKSAEKVHKDNLSRIEAALNQAEGA